MSLGRGTAVLLPGAAGWASFVGAWWVELGHCGGHGLCGVRVALARLFRVVAGVRYVAVEWRFLWPGDISGLRALWEFFSVWN